MAYQEKAPALIDLDQVFDEYGESIPARTDSPEKNQRFGMFLVSKAETAPDELSADVLIRIANHHLAA